MSLAAIIRAMESGADRVKVIAEITGLKVESVHARLHELKRFGVVHAYRVGGRFTRPGHWHTEQEKRYALTTPQSAAGTTG